RVGKNRLELVLEKEAELAKAKQSIGVADSSVQPAGRIVSVPIAHVGEVKRILDLPEQANIAVESLSFHKPTLDDVFLKLTGRPQEEAAVPTAK
ncbi:MAG TPA: hypothetical protein PKV72_06265, partial [Candidatus Peribacteria bacterium]|nr:hypothetical protein [Candidatus Peribacteria bacterium]